MYDFGLYKMLMIASLLESLNCCMYWILNEGICTAGTRDIEGKNQYLPFYLYC